MKKLSLNKFKLKSKLNKKGNLLFYKLGTILCFITNYLQIGPFYVDF